LTSQIAEIKYSTILNWYAGDEEGKGGIYNFVTKRGLCDGGKSRILWTQVETSSTITWKYPSMVLKGLILSETSGVHPVAIFRNKPSARHTYTTNLLDVKQLYLDVIKHLLCLEEKDFSTTKSTG
jgi:hypothetical protein